MFFLKRSGPASALGLSDCKEFYGEAGKVWVYLNVDWLLLYKGAELRHVWDVVLHEMIVSGFARLDRVSWCLPFRCWSVLTVALACLPCLPYGRPVLRARAYQSKREAGSVSWPVFREMSACCSLTLSGPSTSSPGVVEMVGLLRCSGGLLAWSGERDATSQ